MTNGAAGSRSTLRRLCGDGGQDLIEYALIGAFVALMSYGGANSLGTSLSNWYLAMAGQSAEAKDKTSNCSSQGMSSSNGKCHGG